MTRSTDVKKERKNLFLKLGILLVILLCGGFLLSTVFGPSSPDSKFQKVKITRGEISQVVTATGTINPVTTVLVGSQVSGTIKALYADFNSRVKEGQVIAQIDPAIFEAQVEQGRANVLSAQANLLNAQANIENAKANLVKADVSVVDTKRTYERNKPLLEKNVIAQSTLDTAQANYDTAVAQKDVAKAQVESAQSQVASSKAQVEQAKAALKLSETNLRYATIPSPVNGIVISRNVDVGQTVAASLQAPTLFSIAKDLTEMQVDTNVSEADVGRIEVGQEATFTVDAYPERTFQGKVSEVRNAPTTIQNVVTYDIVIRVGNKDFKLKPGMTANVSILIAHHEGVLKVPNSALRFQPSTVKRDEAGAKKNDGSSQAGQAGRDLAERLSKELNLSEEQQAKIKIVLQASAQEIRDIREKSKPEEARIRIQALLRQKLWEFLTEEQRKKVTEMAKSAASGERRSGRVWILSQEGKPVTVPVVLGISNGSYSEIVSGKLQEGAELIVEETSGKKAQGQSGAPSLSRGFGR
jgi:HlyD family secretion protein